MKIKVDHEADALYLTLAEAEAVESQEVAPGVVVDYDEAEQVVGIEILYLSRRTPVSDQAPRNILPAQAD